jgi:hypothetical protein
MRLSDVSAASTR